MKKVLITGANGFIGQTLVTFFASARYEVVATSRGESRLKLPRGCLYESLDVTDGQAVKRVLENHQPDAVINTAAIANVDVCEVEREACWALNVSSVALLAATCKTLNSHFIQLSTDFVFDGTSGPYAETDETNPVNLYGESKLASEVLIREQGLERWSVVRTQLVFGAKGSELYGFPAWVKASLEKGKPINVVDDQVRTPTSVQDLAFACKRLLEKPDNGVYHVSGEETLSIYELAVKVADFYELDADLMTPVPAAYFSHAAKRPLVTGFTLTKAAEYLDLRPHTVEESLRAISEGLR